MNSFFIKEKKIWFALYYNWLRRQRLKPEPKNESIPRKEMPMKMMCDKKMKNNLSLTLTTDDANQEKEINGFALLLGLIFKWKAKPDRKKPKSA